MLTQPSASSTQRPHGRRFPSPRYGMSDCDVSPFENTCATRDSRRSAPKNSKRDLVASLTSTLPSLNARTTTVVPSVSAAETIGVGNDRTGGLFCACALTAEGATIARSMMIDLAERYLNILLRFIGACFRKSRPEQTLRSPLGSRSGLRFRRRQFVTTCSKCVADAIGDAGAPMHLSHTSFATPFGIASAPPPAGGASRKRLDTMETKSSGTTCMPW